ncbi:MAG TPA: SDR family oxidoreductase [Myxococcales bacterium]|nr:SDR family oxidoreductase [Myxococcales bacterium]
MYLLTGFPHILTRHLVEAILAKGSDTTVALLVQERHAEQAKQLYGEHARVFVGDANAMHLGLSTPEYRELSQGCTDIIHVAGLTESRDLEGTRAVLELSQDCRNLRRLTHFSTVFVSGDRRGVIAEDELSAGQAFRSPWEQACFEAEIVVRRAMGQLPCSVVRVPLLLEDAFNGPFATALLQLMTPLGEPQPLPGEGAAPVHLVPSDFVVAAAMAIHHDPRAVGRTFHLVDPHPLSARRIYELVAQRAGKTLPKSTLGTRLTGALFQLPGVERIARSLPPGVAWLDHLAFYTSRNTQELLDHRCPAVETYIDKLIELARAKLRTS